MENTINGGFQDVPTAYDYRMYDRIWQRVSPDLNPYPEVRAAENAAASAAGSGEAPAAAPAAESAPTGFAADGAAAPAAPSAAPAASTTAPAVGSAPAPAMEAPGGEGTLPGAEENPCCMGTEAQISLEVLEGFLEEELAARRYCLNLACRFCSQSANRLLRRIARERQAAARELGAAYYLITGSCYAPAVTVENTQWASLAEALRSCYHQEACSGFNYLRAAEAAADTCLQRLFQRLGDQAYHRADQVMALLGQMIC